MQLLGHANLLSSPTDAHWRGVRKSVAPAFSPIHMKWASFLNPLCIRDRGSWLPSSSHACSCDTLYMQHKKQPNPLSDGKSKDSPLDSPCSSQAEEKLLTCRDATSVVVGKALHLVSILTHKGPGTPFNMDWTLLHLAADVIGNFQQQNSLPFHTT